MKCYRDGGCGPYEYFSCSECPASKESFIKKEKKDMDNKGTLTSLMREIRDSLLQGAIEQHEGKGDKKNELFYLANHLCDTVIDAATMYAKDEENIDDAIERIKALSDMAKSYLKKE